jgi:hypothetical protein
MIKMVVCDGDGTLEIPSPSKGILTLLKKMDELNIGLAVATNSTRREIISNFKKSGLPMPSIIATPNEVGELKASPKFIRYISAQTGIKPNEMVYLGDSDKTDIFCAINSRVLPFASHYSRAGKPKYGLPVTDPATFLRYLETYGMQNAPFFGWNLFLPDDGVEVYALIGQHRDMGLTDILKTFLKDRQEVLVGPKKNVFGSILFHYFLSQSYLSGIIQGINYVTVYPGHLKDSENPILGQYSDDLQKVLGKYYLPGLLTRHTSTVASHTSGAADRNIYRQLSTLQLNETYKNKIRGKRILVLDDFTTYGNSLETARVMLLKGGAESVVGIAFAKYRNTHNLVTINSDWDPFTPFTLDADQISITEHHGNFNQKADDYFSNIIWRAAQS